MRDPASYLCGVARREIRSYCFYHSRLIPIKDHRMPAAEAPTVVSLEEYHANIPYRVAGSSAPEAVSETKRLHREQLRQTLPKLTDRERQIIELRHGLQGGTCEDFTDIARVQAVTERSAYRRYYQVLQKLRGMVAMSLLASDL